MDPISQGTFGALWAAMAMSRRGKVQKNLPSKKTTLLIGALSGMAPDLDVLIRSAKDPMLSLEFHRHFTHSLAFIPIGALICSLVFWNFTKKHVHSFSTLYLLCFCGFASHGILDAFTSYGTQLFWPFSNQRVAWDTMSIIDPLFTLPVLGLLLWRSSFSIQAASFFAFVYLSLGFVQRDRAIAEVQSLAVSRGHHSAIRIQAKPSFGNLVVFRGIYEHGGLYYADAIRVPFWGQKKVYEGSSLNKVILSEFSKIQDSLTYKDIQKFAWFSDDFLARDPRDQNILGDFRYSMIPNGVQPLWGVRVLPQKSHQHVEFVTMRSAQDRSFSQLWKMISGDDP